jgi:hypothetical protein
MSGPPGLHTKAHTTCREAISYHSTYQFIKVSIEGVMIPPHPWYMNGLCQDSRNTIHRGT